MKKQNTSKKADQQILEIAMQQILEVEIRGDLEPRHSDSEDFLEVSVWELKDALTAAFELGRASK